MDSSPPGSSVHGIFQAGILEWAVISFSKRSFWPRDQTHISWVCRWILYHWAMREAHKKCTSKNYYMMICMLNCIYCTTKSLKIDPWHSGWKNEQMTKIFKYSNLSIIIYFVQAFESTNNLTLFFMGFVFLFMNYRSLKMIGRI